MTRPVSRWFERGGIRRRTAVVVAVAVHAVWWFAVREAQPSIRSVDGRIVDAVRADVHESSAPVEMSIVMVPPPPPDTPESVETPTSTTPTSSRPRGVVRPAAPAAPAAPSEAVVEESDAAKAASSEAPAQANDVVDLSPRIDNLDKVPGNRSMASIIRGSDARGPSQSMDSLRKSLDYQPDEDGEDGLSGTALAAKRAERHLRRSLAFHDVTVGMANDWFRELQKDAERGFRPSASDLDNPSEVSQANIFANLAKDPTAWDDEAKRILTPLLEASSLSSQDSIKRLPRQPMAQQGHKDTSAERQAMLDDLLGRKVQGLSVRFAFEVDVHHDGAGQVTAIDVLRTSFQKQLQEKIRLAIEDAVKKATPAPALVNRGQPFRSKWVFAATWFIDPPGCMFMPSDAMGAMPGTAQGMCGGTFDIGPDGLKTSSFDVQQKVQAMLVRVDPLR